MMRLFIYFGALFIIVVSTEIKNYTTNGTSNDTAENEILLNDKHTELKQFYNLTNDVVFVSGFNSSRDLFMATLSLLPAYATVISSFGAILGVCGSIMVFSALSLAICGCNIVVFTLSLMTGIAQTSLFIYGYYDYYYTETDPRRGVIENINKNFNNDYDYVLGYKYDENEYNYFFTNSYTKNNVNPTFSLLQRKTGFEIINFQKFDQNNSLVDKNKLTIKDIGISYYKYHLQNLSHKSFPFNFKFSLYPINELNKKLGISVLIPTQNSSTFDKSLNKLAGKNYNENINRNKNLKLNFIINIEKLKNQKFTTFSLVKIIIKSLIYHNKNNKNTNEINDKNEFDFIFKKYTLEDFGIEFLFQMVDPNEKNEFDSKLIF
ncbi:uncharacterized protein ASCRUDRAFT_123968 [Ascoidea rubescens DSM 1968]|uniref:Uncharacterized protein n=1 Tax=Ascoidea rubescens DSM 1968 TaxID=1344418 RepID=A0A1D2VMK4_9ASCO|nr:hypothetical protein ASCRUDRAFT_123968 [Ascoidea rubescens DSM 1968]ODV62785.1 hypothetical protein ASCRUDRAFT_123968 [Ascoidea rubescens DSM 1968]